MSDPWMIAAIIEGIIILIAIWFAFRFRWSERKREKREQGADWSQVDATISKEPIAFLGFYRVVAEFDGPESRKIYTFREWHHLSDKPIVGAVIPVRVNFPDNEDEYYMDIEQSW